jgi:CheY-like chemotaxis protein
MNQIKTPSIPITMNSSSYDSDIHIHIPFKKRVIIIDDEKLVRNTFIRYFSKLNQSIKASFEVSEASNALEGLNLIYEGFLNKREFDIIIVDEYMPFMKGSTLIKIINQINKEGYFNKMLIISHTAFDTPEMRLFIKNSGADVIWNKPISFEDFQSFVANL